MVSSSAQCLGLVLVAGFLLCIASAWPPHCTAGYRTVGWHCEMCHLGKYCPTPSNDNEKICPKGSFCEERSTAPTLCGPGTCQPEEQKWYCNKCAAGRFAQGQGQVTCDLCPAGNSCQEGANLPTMCQPGQFQDKMGQAICEICPGGRYSGWSSASCLECPAGYVCGAECSRPVSCGVGEYSEAGSSTCKACQPGFFLPNNTMSLPCPGGSSCAGGLIIPRLCPEGSFCPPQAERPTPCNTGSFSLKGAAECTLCEPGKFADDQGSTTCSECFPGTFQAEQGGAHCHPCQPDTFTSEYGVTQCRNCSEKSVCTLGAWTQFPQLLYPVSRSNWTIQLPILSPPSGLWLETQDTHDTFKEALIGTGVLGIPFLIVGLLIWNKWPRICGVALDDARQKFTFIYISAWGGLIFFCLFLAANASMGFCCWYDEPVKPSTARLDTVAPGNWGGVSTFYLPSFACVRTDFHVSQENFLHNGGYFQLLQVAPREGSDHQCDIHFQCTGCSPPLTRTANVKVEMSGRNAHTPRIDFSVYGAGLTSLNPLQATSVDGRNETSGSITAKQGELFSGDQPTIATISWSATRFDGKSVGFQPNSSTVQPGSTITEAEFASANRVIFTLEFQFSETMDVIDHIAWKTCAWDVYTNAKGYYSSIIGAVGVVLWAGSVYTRANAPLPPEQQPLLGGVNAHYE